MDDGGEWVWWGVKTGRRRGGSGDEREEQQKRKQSRGIHEAAGGAWPFAEASRTTTYVVQLYKY